MPAARRPSWVSLAAFVLGAPVLILGLIYAIALGPSGRVEASARVAAPGVVVIGKDALRASSTPVHVLVRSASAGQVTGIRMLDGDAHASLESSRHAVLDRVSFLPRALPVSESGDGPLPRAMNRDTFLADPMTADRVELDVTPGRMPQALLIYPGEPGSPRDDAVDVTMTWSNAAWFWQAVALALAGAALLVAGVWSHRRRLRASGPNREDRDPAGATEVPDASGAGADR